MLLLWIHKSGDDVLHKILDKFVHKECQIFHVLSSSSGDPEEYKNAILERYQNVKCVYRTVKLGSIKVGNVSRWLTHEEISNGTIEAMEKEKDVVIGTVPLS